MSLLIKFLSRKLIFLHTQMLDVQGTHSLLGERGGSEPPAPFPSRQHRQILELMLRGHIVAQHTPHRLRVRVMHHEHSKRLVDRLLMRALHQAVLLGFVEVVHRGVENGVHARRLDTMTTPLTSQRT